MKKLKNNQGRNVINIKELKNHINTFSKKRKLSDAVESWLSTIFVRWLINHYPQVQVVQSVERYKLLVKGQIPSWFVPQSSGVEFIYIDTQHPSFLELLTKCSEFLSSRDEKIEHKFPRMTVEHILLKHKEEHLRMQKKAQRYVETSGEALEKVFCFEDFHVVKFLAEKRELSLEMAGESALMQHCLGEFDNVQTGEGGYGAYYIDLVKKEEIFLYSLRDEKNLPHATIALYKENNTLWLEQIKGKQNLAPIERYVPASVAFFNFLNVQHDYHYDCLAMGVVYAEGKSRHLSEIYDESLQQRLVAYKSSFIHALPNPTKATMWLATLRSAKEMEKLESATDAMKIASLIQHPILMNRLKFDADIRAKKLLQQKESYSIVKRIFSFPKLQVGRV